MIHTITRPSLRLATLIAGLRAVSFAFVPSSHADDFYRDTSVNEASWAVASNWIEDAGGVTVATVAPGASDHAIFSITDLNGTSVVPRILSNMSVGGMTFNNTVLFNLHGGSNRTLTVGGGGVTKATGDSQATIGSGTGSEGVLVRFAATQTWANNTDGTLLIRNSAASANDAGAVVLTLQANGAGNISNSGAFSEGTGSTLGLIVDSSGTGVVSIQSSTHTGGTTVKSGILQVGGANVGIGSFQLGDTSGTATTKVRVSTSTAIATNLTVVAGSSGTKTLEFTANAPAVQPAPNGTYDGDISLADSLILSVRAVGTGALINGDISGTGDLIKGQYLAGVSPANSGLLTLAGANTYTGDTFVNNGAFTLADGGSLTFSIGADGINNQITGTSTGLVTLAGDFNFTFGLGAFADGNSWTIVDREALSNVSFAGTFGINGFSEVDNVWIRTVSQGTFTFTESDGVLSFAAVPEPSAFAALAGLCALGLVATRRRRSA